MTEQTTPEPEHVTVTEGGKTTDYTFPTDDEQADTADDGQTFHQPSEFVKPGTDPDDEGGEDDQPEQA